MMALACLFLGLAIGIAIGWLVAGLIVLGGDRSSFDLPPTTTRSIRRNQRESRADLRRVLPGSRIWRD